MRIHLLLFSFLCCWQFTFSDDVSKDLNSTVLSDSVNKQNTANTIEAASPAENKSDDVVAGVASSRPMPKEKLDLIQAPAASAAQSVPKSASSDRLVPSATTGKEQLPDAQLSNEFADLSSPIQLDSSQDNGIPGEKEKVAGPLEGLVNNDMRTVMPFSGADDIDAAEDTHFLYYIMVFGIIVACLYVASHNKKKILGFIVEGRRPTIGSRRSAFRYRRLSQHDGTESGPTNVIY